MLKIIMSYIEFFGFKEHPFRITPDVEFYFTSETHSETFESMKYFIGSDEGFLTLIGEPGTGKTITVRKFLNELPEDVEYAYILFPSLDPEDMFRAVLEDFGYKIEPGVTKNTLFSGFREFLTEKKRQGKRILLIIDEAQNLPNATLEELRILSNLETEKEKLIQFILAGQPELSAKLNSPELRQLKQRISLQTELKLLNALEIERYVVFRLSKAGFEGQYPDGRFYKKLVNITSGNPRLINLTMERALMSAYLKHSKFLAINDLDAAAESLKLSPQTAKTETGAGKLVYALSGVIAALVLVIAFQFIQKNRAPEILNQPAVQETAVIEKAEAKPAAPAETEDVREISPAAPEKPEPQPEPEPVKEEKTQAGYTSVAGLNLRKTPTTLSDNVLARLDKGVPVAVLKKFEDWLFIETVTEEGIATGWVYGSYIEINGQK